MVLTQEHDKDKEHPRLHLSKKFTSIEKKDIQQQKKNARQYYVTLKKLEGYIDGQTEFHVQTDHYPLMWLKTIAGKNPQYVLWALT